MMEGLAIFNSGNYAFAIYNVLEKKGLVFEVVATPCKIARGGCGYCLRFPIEYMEMIINEGKLNKMPVLEVYKIIPLFSRNKYERIYSIKG
jgi:hypothetical protein